VSWGAGTQYDVNVISFELSYIESVLESTAYGDTTRKFVRSGIKEWRGSYVARLDDTAPIAGPGIAAATLTITAASGRTYAGSALVESIDVSHSFDGQPQATVTFVGVDTLTIS